MLHIHARVANRTVKGPLTLPVVRIELLWLLAALVIPAIMTAGTAALTIDSWWGLTMGRLMVEARRPLVDAVVSFVPAAPGSVHGQWLSHVLLYGAYSQGGEIGLRLAAGALAALSWWLLAATGRRLGGSPRTAAFGAILAAFLAANNLGIRAQLSSYLMFGLVYLLLSLRHRHARIVYLLPAVFAVWANLHGAFLTGLLLVGLHVGGEAVDSLAASRAGRPARWTAVTRLGLVLGLAVLAAMLNPLGPGVYVYVWSIATYASSKTLIPEWQPTTLHSYPGLALAAASVLMGLTLWRSRRPVAPLDVVLLLVFGGLAWTSQRQVVWWGLLAGPIFARYAALPTPGWLTQLGRPPAEETPGRRVFTTALAALLVALACTAPLWRPVLGAALAGETADRLYAPVGVMDAAAALPEGARLYVFQPWTGYAAWRLWPRQQSMVDARFETHPDSVWDDYQAISTAQADWERLLDRYRVEYLVLEARQQASLAQLAVASRRWTPLYRDDAGTILARTGPR